jgi:hypothetical protein
LFFIGFIITGHLHWAFYRLSWMVIPISHALISLSSLYVTPEIYKPIRTIFGRSKHYKNHREEFSSINVSTTR